jgi:hypothetical protein|tara:strand:- start:432 stop:665 length:234 start_codon:yes stop_codon:yes gene_type:complete
MAKRVTTQQLANEIEQIKDNHLAHMADDIDELKQAVKENRTFFQDRLDRMDNRIWLILGATVSTLVTIIGAFFGGMM